MIGTPDDAVCTLVRKLAAADESAIPGDIGRLVREMRVIAVELMRECDMEWSAGPAVASGAKLVATHPASPFASAPHPSVTVALQRGVPEIKSPQILEWDYEGELSARREERSAHARLIPDMLNDTVRMSSQR